MAFAASQGCTPVSLVSQSLSPRPSCQHPLPCSRDRDKSRWRRSSGAPGRAGGLPPSHPGIQEASALNGWARTPPPPTKEHRTREQGRCLSRATRGGCAPPISEGPSPKRGAQLVLQGRTEGPGAPSVDTGLRGLHAASEASEKTIVRTQTRSPQSTKGHLSRDTGLCHTAAQCWAPPQLARTGATSCFIFLFFLLLLKEKWWEGPLGYAYALTIDWFLWPAPELPPGHSASTRPFFLPSFVSSFIRSCSQQPRVLGAGRRRQVIPAHGRTHRPGDRP